jgi:hypothetical protein
LRYHCPLCDGQTPPWHLYAALGRPICDECASSLLEDGETYSAACHVFAVTPALLDQIIENQRPLPLSSDAVQQRFD